MAAILIVEDENVIAEDLAENLRGLGHEVSGIAASGEEALELAPSLRPDLVLMDIRLQGEMSGIEAATVIRRELDLPVVYLTAHSGSTTLEQAKCSDAYGYLMKPFGTLSLETTVQIALHKHETERRLRQREEHYRIVADFTRDWEFWIGPDGRFKYVSPSVLRITGREIPAEMSAEEFLKLVVHSDDWELRLRHLRDDLIGQSPGELEFRIVRPDGDIRWIHHVCLPIHDERGQFLGTRGSNRDITERKRAEALLSKAQQELVRRERIWTLSKLVGSLAQDMRGPLNIIGNNLSLWGRSEQLSKQAREVLAEMSQALGNCNRTISGMTDYVREAQKTGRLF